MFLYSNSAGLYPFDKEAAQLYIFVIQHQSPEFHAAINAEPGKRVGPLGANCNSSSYGLFFGVARRTMLKPVQYDDPAS